MALVVAPADRLMMLAGLFDKYRKTGGTFDGREAAFVASQLRALSEQVRADAEQAELLAEQLLEQALGKPKPAEGSAPRLMRGILDVIEGGRA